MQVTILYFAQFADLSGKTEETRRLEHNDPAHLYRSLKEDYGFPHEFEQIQVAVNHQLSAHRTLLAEGDQIAFLPPMTGG